MVPKMNTSPLKRGGSALMFSHTATSNDVVRKVGGAYAPQMPALFSSIAYDGGTSTVPSAYCAKRPLSGGCTTSGAPHDQPPNCVRW